jgi:hypothetical protein
MRNPRIVGAWIVGLTSLVLYTLTMAPTVAFWDVGEFIATAHHLGVPHPPGAPTFVLLGHLVTMLPTPFVVAAEVNFISVVASALTALLLYGIVLEIFDLWRSDQEAWDGFGPMVEAVAAATAALAYAFCYSAWFNAVEAEVYGLSMTVTALCFWLALRHVRGGGEPKRASLLLLIAYLLGIGAGNHLLALLTVPSILILLWYMDRPTLTRIDLWIWSVVLFAAGYSIYLMLFIRSGLNPPIDMNNPETLENISYFIQRKQYGTEGLIESVLSRKADWGYQINYQFLRYFRMQFLLPFYVLAVIGALVNLKRDRRTFLAVAGLWVIMGFGLVVYLNMPDPQPRDRDYIFVGCFFATAIWVGTGMAGLASYARSMALQTLSRRAEKGGTQTPATSFPAGKTRTSVSRWVAVSVGVLGAVLVVVQTAGFYHSHDRAGDYLAWDYSYNILQSCPPDAILITNGDNDTYPLWYLQEVEGIRKDVQVVILTLLNTRWYIKHLRDRSDTMPISLGDPVIDAGIGGFIVPQDTTISIAGATVRLRRGQAWRTQDRMVAHIVAENNWERPIYFALTVPSENHAGFTMNCQLEGFAYHLLADAQIADHPIRPLPGVGTVEPDIAMRNLKERYQYRGVIDPKIYKDGNAAALLGNYNYVLGHVTRALAELDRTEEAGELLLWADSNVSLNSRLRLIAAQFAYRSGDTESARGMWHAILADPDATPNVIVSAFANLIFAYAISGETGRAAEIVEQWLERTPDDAVARSWLDSLRAGTVPEALKQLGAALNERV